MAEDVDVMTGMDGQIGNAASAAFGTAVGITGALDRDGFRPGLAGCRFTNGSFQCPGTDQNGLMVTRTVTLFDAANATETAYDPLLTATIHIVVDISGNRGHGPWTATADRKRDITVTGLAGSETTRTVNGTGSETITASRVTHNPRTYTLDCTSTIADVVLPVRADGGNGWPVSGSITRVCTVNVTQGPNAGMTFTRTITITFNGTAMVTGSVNGTPFTFDLPDHTDEERGD